MPFTGSHPAAVLPFLRTPLPASALVIGSMAPDLPYFLPLPQPYPTHTALSLVTSDLVLGALAWAVWHGLLAQPALATAPAPLRGRLAGRVPLGLATRLTTARQVALLLTALVLGSATHVLWDEFTHPRRWGTAHIPPLAENWGLLPGYRWLQYASGLVGGLVLLLWALRWWRGTAAAPVDPVAATRWAYGAVIGVACVAGVGAALRSPSLGSAGFDGATVGGGTAAALTVVLAVAWHVRKRSGRVPGGRP